MSIGAYLVLCEKPGLRPGKGPPGELIQVRTDDSLNAVSGCYLREGVVVGMPHGVVPSGSNDPRAIFVARIDGESGENAAFVWNAYSDVVAARARVSEFALMSLRRDRAVRAK